MYTKLRGHNDYPLELWLGRVSFRFLIFEVSLDPSFGLKAFEFFPTERVRDFLERSLLRNWMKDWLRYVHWYWSVANSPDVSLSDFFSASVYEKEKNEGSDANRASSFAFVFSGRSMIW